MTDLLPILCRECGRDINEHTGEWDSHARDCPLAPSDIARALLAAEPTADEVQAATDALMDVGHDLHCGADVPTDEAARAALRAARKARP